MKIVKGIPVLTISDKLMEVIQTIGNSLEKDYPDLLTPTPVQVTDTTAVMSAITPIITFPQQWATHPDPKGMTIHHPVVIPEAILKIIATLWKIKTDKENIEDSVLATMGQEVQTLLHEIITLAIYYGMKHLSQKFILGFEGTIYEVVPEGVEVDESLTVDIQTGLHTEGENPYEKVH